MGGLAQHRVWIIGALAFEVAHIVPRTTDVGILATGPGPDNAEKVLSRALSEAHPERIVAVGLCGGLSPKASVASLAIPSEIVASHDTAPIVPWSWPDLKAQGRLVTTSQVVATPADKARLYEQTGADWVDMETYYWAQAAQRHHIPVTVVRVVVDGWLDYLPQWRRMASWPSLLTLASHSFRARSHLRRVARWMLCAS